MIRVKNLTKDFGKRKGIFEISFEIEDGEVFGLLGPEGAGKSTVVRQLMGFADPSGGRCFINGKNCTSSPQKIRTFTGYLPEKSKLPADMSGLDFLRFMAEMRGEKSIERGLDLAGRLHLDPDLPIRKMNAQQQQLLRIASVLMHDTEVLILDEPMKDLKAKQEKRVIEALREEKDHGKTIFVTSDQYEEIESLCDRVGMIQGGLLINIDDIAQIRAMKRQSYVITFATEQDALRFVKEDFQVLNISGAQLTVSLPGEMIPLVRVLGDYPVVAIETIEQDLEDIFAHYYGGEENA